MKRISASGPPYSPGIVLRVSRVRIYSLLNGGEGAGRGEITGRRSLRDRAPAASILESSEQCNFARSGENHVASEFNKQTRAWQYQLFNGNLFLAGSERFSF